MQQLVGKLCAYLHAGDHIDHGIIASEAYTTHKTARQFVFFLVGEDEVISMIKDQIVKVVNNAFKSFNSDSAEIIG